MGKTKTVQKNEPWQPAQKFIIQGLENSGRVFDEQQPYLDRYSKMQMDTYGRLAPGAEQGIRGSQSLVNDTLAGRYLNGNPYLDGQLEQTRENVSNDVLSRYSGAGRYGSAYGMGELTRQLANAENNMRFQNYAMERGYQNDAIGQAQQLMGGSQSLLNNAAELPWIGVGALNGNVRNASGGYGTTTTTQKQGIGSMLGGIAGAGLAGWASGGFKGI